MVGHSIGEYVAACLAGVFSLPDAAGAGRGPRPAHATEAAGRDAAVSLSEQAMQPFLNKELDLASINGPASCVVSGPTEAIQALQNRLQADQVKCGRCTPHTLFIRR